MKSFTLAGISIINSNYSELLEIIDSSVKTKAEIEITYANFHTLNQIVDQNLSDLYNSFTIVHSDGIGIYLAIKLLFKNNISRITGSDFYRELIDYSIENKIRLFFFGDTPETLEMLRKRNDLRIVGTASGYSFSSEKVVDEINIANPDILIVGLGSPKQEKWISNNKDKITTNIIISVGDGIKLFAKTKKRGFSIIQKLGFEWLIRLINEPKRLWKRYLIGIPLFIFRIIKLKLTLSK